MNQANINAAVELASHGIRVFPCNPDKTPRVKGWGDTPLLPGWQVGAKWSSHPDALPAIPVGAMGWVVFDCDRKPGGPDGVEAFYSICSAHGVDLSGALIVNTPGGGQHIYFRTETPYGNSRGSLPPGIDVRGVGGYCIAPGATLPDGRSYKIVQGSLSAIPALPDALAALLRPKVNPLPAVHSQTPHEVTERERAYAASALEDEANKLKKMRAGDGRNHALNIAAHSMGTMAGAGWIEPATVAQSMFEAASINGHTVKHGERQTKDTIESGLKAGMMKPRDPLPAELPHIDLSELRCKGVLVFSSS
jgi:hypothetical protein